MSGSAAPTSPAPLPLGHLLRRLAAFLLASSVLTNALLLGPLQVPEHQTLLQSISWFLTAKQGGDSWRPMRKAHAFLVPAEERSRGFYEKQFWSPAVRHKGFQYPPSALLPVHALKALLGEAWYAAVLAITWLFVPVTAAAVAGIFALSLAAAGLTPPSGPTRRDWLGIAAVGVLASLTFYPVMIAYRGGQASAWLNGLYAIALWLWLRHARGAAGVCVAAMALIKPQHALLLFWGLLRRQFRFALGLGAAALLGLGLSLALFGVATHRDYVPVLRFLSQRGESYYPNQSANGLLHRLLGNGSNVEWMDHFPPYHPWVHAGTLAAAAALLGSAYFPRGELRARGEPADFTAAALAGTMASPIAWEHHYGLLLPMFAWMLPALIARPVLGGATLPLLAVSYWLAANSFHVTTRLADTGFNFLQSYLYAAALVALLLLLLLRRRDGVAPPQS